jgi:hypothetical protein
MSSDFSKQDLGNLLAATAAGRVEWWHVGDRRRKAVPLDRLLVGVDEAIRDGVAEVTLQAEFAAWKLTLRRAYSTRYSANGKSTSKFEFVLHAHTDASVRGTTALDYGGSKPSLYCGSDDHRKLMSDLFHAALGRAKPWWPALLPTAEELVDGLRKALGEAAR